MVVLLACNLVLFLIVLVWIITISYVDRVSVVTEVKKYEKEISGEKYDYFPVSIPEGAKNVEFTRLCN